MKRLFLLGGLIGMLVIACPSQLVAQENVSMCSFGIYQDYDGIVQVYSSARNRDDWYRVTLIFNGNDVSYTIEGKSKSVSKLSYKGKANREEWFNELKTYLDQVYG